MNGIFLIGLGAIWNEVRLSPGLKTMTFWIALIGTYGNWLITTTAAVFGTSALSPITGTPHGGQPWQEKVVTAGFMVIGIAIVACAVTVLCGLRRAARCNGVWTTRSAPSTRPELTADWSEEFRRVVSP